MAASLKSYLERHPEIDACCTKRGSCRYLTTENKDKFAESAKIFMHEPVADVDTITLA